MVKPNLGVINFKDFYIKVAYFTVFLTPTRPQQNSIVERKHRHIVEMRLTLLGHFLVSISHWYSTFQTVVHIINLIPPSTSPYKSP